jgi:hypothetical protein
MTSFEDFVKDVMQARSKAATFHKVDLHVHSYESPDFPKLGDKPNSATGLTDDDHNAEAQNIIDAAKQVGSLGFRMGRPHMGVLRLGESAIALKVKVNALE